MSLINTYRQEIRAQLPNPLDKNEWRFTRYGLLNAVREMTASGASIMSQDLKKKAQDSEGTDLKIPVFKLDGDVTVKNTRSCVIGDLENTTELVLVTWVTLVADFSMMKAQYHKNMVSYLEDMDRKIARIDNAFAKVIEDMIYAKLDAEKSSIYDSPLVGVGGSYPLVANTIQVPLALQETFFNDMEAIMEGDDFYEAPYKVLGNTTLRPPVRHYMGQGNANDENLQYQFGNYHFRFSNHLVNGATKKATGFVMTDGTVGILTRLPVDSRIPNNKAGDGTEWDKTFLKVTGAEVGVMYKSKCDDLSNQVGLEHLTASHKENFQLSFDVALVTPYNSDPATKAGVIKKFEFLTT